MKLTKPFFASEDEQEINSAFFNFLIVISAKVATKHDDDNVADGNLDDALGEPSLLYNYLANTV